MRDLTFQRVRRSLTFPRSPQGQPFASQIQTALAVQAARIEKVAFEEKQRKAERKRPPSASSTPEAPEAKRQKLEPQSSDTAALLASFDFTTLPAALVTDLVVANLQAFSEAAFVEMVQAYRRGKAAPPAPAAGPSTSAGAPPPQAAQTPPPSANGQAAYHPPSKSSTPIPTGPRAAAVAEASKSATPVPRDVRESSDIRSMSRSPPGTPPVKAEAEPVDPLQMDIDEEEIEYEPDRLNLEVSCRWQIPLL